MTTRPSAVGPQYSGDGDFKARARLLQSRFRADHLGLDRHNRYGNRLAAEDAAAGKNFYPSTDVLDGVRERYGLGDTALCRDMLRSEHIPFNFFVPLRRCSWARDLVAGWVGKTVTEVTRIRIEWAPEPKSEYLDDNTSFDAFIEYISATGDRGAVGVEVKYTEGDYPWGKTERARMLDEESPYLHVHRASDLYRSDALDALRTPRFKQLWRNQLLGEAMLGKRALGIGRFASVLLFPNGNEHFVAATSEYRNLLAPERRGAFVAVTFEEFIARAREFATGDEAHGRWLAYLERRYIP